MKKTQLISTLLLIAMLAGCGTVEDGNDETTSSGSDTTEETTADTSVKDDLPADLDFTGKELRILSTENTRNAPIIPEEATGDVLNDTIFERNNKICERFGITMRSEERR